MPKTYKNISGLTQLGIEPGQTGEAELTPDEEHRMINRGAIEVVGEATESTDAPDTNAPETSEPEKTQEETEAEQKAADEAAAAAKAEAERGGRRGRS